MTADSATSAERWEQVKAILETVLDLPPTERLPHLARACDGDEALEREVLAYLEADDEAGDFIVQPIFSLRGDGTSDPNLGRVIGAYRLVKCLARGGMGAVYLGERADQEFEQKAALKLIKRGMDTDEIVGRFRAERQILAHLVHPSIARLLDGGTTDDGLPYFVMEYVEGVPLNVYCDEERLSLRRRLEIFEEVCRAVQFAHRNLVVHRDLKPGNILVTPEGRPKLLDFGIAKLLAPQDSLSDERRVGPALVEATLQGTLPLTPAYASPEQARGEPITTASDVYSLGVVLYELLTGHRPYEPQALPPGEWPRVIAETRPARPSTVVARLEEIPGADGIVRRIEPDEVAAARRAEPRQLVKTLKGDLDNIILTALAKESARRYGSAGELADDIRRYLEDLPVRARKDSAAYRAKKFVQRNTAAVVAASVFVLFLMAFAASMTYAAVQLAKREAEALTAQGRAEETLKFFVEVLSGSLPDRSQGKEVTIQEAMDVVVQKLYESPELEQDPLLKADLLQGTGRIFYGLRETEKADDLVQNALRLRLQNLSPEHLEVGRSWNLLSLIRRWDEKFDDAKDFSRQAIAVFRPLAEKNPSVKAELGAALGNLASRLEDEEEYEEAEALINEALDALRTIFAEDSDEVLSAVHTLAEIQQGKGELSAAKANYDKVLAGRRKACGDKACEDVAGILNNLIVFWVRNGQCEGVGEWVDENLKIRRTLYEGESGESGEAEQQIELSDGAAPTEPVPAIRPSGLLRKLAIALNTQGFYETYCGSPSLAVAPYEEALRIYRELELAGAPQIQRNLAAALAASGQPERCRAEAEEALNAYLAPELENRDPAQVAKTQSVLGGCLVDLGRLEEAEPLLVESWAPLQGEELNTRQAAAERLVSFYEARGDEEQAERWRKELAAVEAEIEEARKAVT